MSHASSRHIWLYTDIRGLRSGAKTSNRGLPSILIWRRIIKILREITDNLSGVFRRIFLRDERFYPLGLGIVVPAFVRPAEAKFVPYQAAFVDDVQRRIQKRTAGHIVVIIAECRNVVTQAM